MNEKELNKFLGKKVSIKTVDNLNFTVQVNQINNGELSGIDKFHEPITLAVSDIQRCFVVSGTDRKW